MRATTLTNSFAITTPSFEAKLGQTFVGEISGIKYMVVDEVSYHTFTNYARKISGIAGMVDYHDALHYIIGSLKAAGIDKHVRHEFEREAIKEWGGHDHTSRVRALFW